MPKSLRYAFFLLGGTCVVLAVITLFLGHPRFDVASPRTLIFLAVALMCGAVLAWGAPGAASPRTDDLLAGWPDLPDLPEPRSPAREPRPSPAPAEPIDFSLLDDRRDDAAYVRETLGRLRPATLLAAVRVEITRGSAERPGGPYTEGIGIAHTRGIGATPAHEAAMNALADIRRRLFDTDPVLRTALARLVAAGVRPIWTTDGTYAFQGRILRLEIHHDALARLQDMAADDAGLKTPEERAEAVEIHRRWLLQNYHPDWKDYCRKWPTLYADPYR